MCIDSLQQEFNPLFLYTPRPEKGILKGGWGGGVSGWSPRFSWASCFGGGVLLPPFGRGQAEERLFKFNRNASKTTHFLWHAGGRRVTNRRPLFGGIKTSREFAILRRNPSSLPPHFDSAQMPKTGSCLTKSARFPNQNANFRKSSDVITMAFQVFHWDERVKMANFNSSTQNSFRINLAKVYVRIVFHAFLGGGLISWTNDCVDTCVSLCSLSSIFNAWPGEEKPISEIHPEDKVLSWNSTANSFSEASVIKVDVHPATEALLEVL